MDVCLECVPSHANGSQWVKRAQAITLAVRDSRFNTHQTPWHWELIETAGCAALQQALHHFFFWQRRRRHGQAQSMNLVSQPARDHASTSSGSTTLQKKTLAGSPSEFLLVQTLTHTRRVASWGWGTRAAVKRPVTSTSWTGPRYVPRGPSAGPRSADACSRIPIEGARRQHRPPLLRFVMHQSPLRTLGRRREREQERRGEGGDVMNRGESRRTITGLSQRANAGWKMPTNMHSLMERAQAAAYAQQLGFQELILCQNSTRRQLG